MLCTKTFTEVKIDQQKQLEIKKKLKKKQQLRASSVINILLASSVKL